MAGMPPSGLLTRNECEAVEDSGPFYSGARDEKGVVVVVERDGKVTDLPLGLQHVNHSPDGFEWGYGGSGPSQLAFAVLLDYFESATTARRYYRGFLHFAVEKFAHTSWSVTGDEVRNIILAIQNERVH